MKLVRRHVADVGIEAQQGVTASLEITVKMGIAAMQHGYSNAVDRLLNATAGDDTDANDVYAALFEASNWLVSIADRAGDVFKLDPLQRGIRFARNATQHEWASAVEYAPDRGWVWRRTDVIPVGIPDREGRADHMLQLAGRHVTDAFLRLKSKVMALRHDL